MMLVIHHQKTIALEKSLWPQKHDYSMALETVYMDTDSLLSEFSADYKRMAE